MITNVQSVTVHVSDQDKALDFYVNKLGFEKGQDQQFGPNFRWLEVLPPGSSTRLILAHSYGAWEPERIGKFTGMVLNAEDIQGTYETLRDRGVTFTEPPTMQPWGMMQAQFEDGDGNGYVLVGR